MPLLTRVEFRALALSLKNKKYKLGDPSPYNKDNPSSLDCSGVCCWLLNKSGNDLGDTTAAGLWNLTVPVTGTPQAGDMAFLANHSGRKAPAGFKYGIGHVAMLTGAKNPGGDYEIIEARGSAVGVVVTTLSYWKNRKYYAGLRRLKTGIKFAETPVTPPVVTNSTIDVRIMHASLEAEHFGGPDAYSQIAKQFAKTGAHIITMTESVSGGRAIFDTELEKLTGHKWQRWAHPGNRIAIFWRQDMFTYGTARSITFAKNDPWHGALCMPLKSKVTGKGIDVIAVHNRPQTVASDAQKNAFIKQSLKLIGKWSPLLCGDWAKNADPILTGFTRVSLNMDTYDKKGVQKIDAQYSQNSNPVQVVSSEMFNPGEWSDHSWPIVTVRL